MWLKSSLIIAGTFVVAATVAFVARAQPVADEGQTAQVLFVCRNGVSMSVWSAAYFNRLASERGLSEHAIARAAIASYTAVPLRMRFALAVDGFRLNGYQPHVVTADEARGAEHVVLVQGTDDTVLPPDMQADVRDSEVWRGFSPMRENYFPARAALRAKVEDLVARLAAKATSTDERSPVERR
jgi:hypothetical protein